MYYVNSNFVETDRIFSRQGRGKYLKLDMNENVDGLPKEFIEEFKARITPDFLCTYPESVQFEKAYASFMNLEFNTVMATNGSDMAIRYVFETFGEQGKDVITVSPSFEMYRINAKLMGMNHKAIGYNDDLTINIEEIVNSIDCNTRIVVLLNPNNPIGNIYDESEVRMIIEVAQKNSAVVIIDEAYYYFCKQTFVKLTQEYSNVMVFRTFSKLFAMAACRLGVIIANPEIIGWLKHGKLTFEVNSFALLLGEMIIERPEIINYMVQQANEGKEYLLERLSVKGYRTRYCEGNYVFVYPKGNVKEIEKKLEEKGILVKTYSHSLLANAIRVTTASKKIMDEFLEIFFAIDVNENNES